LDGGGVVSGTNHLICVNFFNMASFDSVFVDEAELVDGYSANEIFSNSECQGITFDV
jgi:hypothetical protein